MTPSLSFVAIDLGADSGRLMLGRLADGRVALEELHRFDSHPVALPGGLFTDVAHIWREIGTGLRAAAARCGGRIDGVGVDTWGVDFALFDAEGGLLGLPHHYRDTLAEGMIERVQAIVPLPELFASTGVQLLPFNSVFQLLGLREKRPSFLAAADHLLMIPDLFTYWLGGQPGAERTIASTSQCYDPSRGDWAHGLIDKLGLPRRLFPVIRDPGSVAGELQPAVRAGAGLGRAPVLAPGGHDTAMAVAAVPAASGDFAYISSGTWSLLGTELPGPVLDDRVRVAGFTNEVGVGGTIRFLKNICGLWLVQESRRVWADAGESYSHAELAALAEQAPAWTAVIDVDAPDFARPGDMPARIADFCRRSGQAVPDSPGAIVRVALESLALKYRYTLLALEALTGRHPSAVHIVGGGSHNKLLCQLAADATERVVLAGPAEATAIGNVLMQALGVGQIGGLADLRDIVRRSVQPQTYEPRPSAALRAAYGRLEALIGNAGPAVDSQVSKT